MARYHEDAPNNLSVISIGRSISDIDWASRDVAEQEIIGNWLTSSGDFGITLLPPGYVAPVAPVEKTKDSKSGKIVGYLIKAGAVAVYVQ